MFDLVFEQPNSSNALSNDKDFSSVQSIDVNRLKNILTTLGMFSSGLEIDLSDAQNVTNKSSISSTSYDFILGMLTAFEIATKQDDVYRESIATFRQNDNMRIQANDLDMNSIQSTNVAKNTIATELYVKILRIILFFKELSIQMNSMKRQREELLVSEKQDLTSVKTDETIRGKTNVSQTIIAVMSLNDIKKLSSNVNKGYTMLGMQIDDDFSFSDMKKTTKDEEPAELTLHSEEIEKLKNLRNEALQLSLDDSKGLSQEKGFQMTMKSLKQSGFIGVGNLMIFLSILITIVEFFIICIGFLNN